MFEAEPSEALRAEFNRWADAGKGESMADDHLPITLPVLARMRIASDDNLLDVGCGAGWLSRRLAKEVPEGRVVGMDISDEMIRRARQASAEAENLVYIVGGVEEIPWESNFFTKAVSVESAYYWPDPARGLGEIFRVLRSRGSVWILINYFRDNPHCHQWGKLLAVPTHLLTALEWEELFRAAGFVTVGSSLIPDPTPIPEAYSGRWFADAAQLRAFREIGALTVFGTKPE